MKQKLSKVLYNKRMEKNLSMEKAAKEIGINYVTYWRLETSGVVNISFNTISKLAAWLEISERDVRDLC